MARQDDAAPRADEQPATYKAIRIHEFGGLEKLQQDELPLPEPGAHEVLVKVHAASVNPVDYKIREGQYREVREDKLPYTLGRDLCGTLVKTGDGVESFTTGDPVFAMVGIDRGGYTEYAILKDTEAVAKPASLDAVAAAAVPLAAMTAWQGLFDHGGLKPGQRVLIHGGAGGVGHFAIQFAKAKGAFVLTTASGDHLDFVRALGADEAIDYKEQRFEDVARDIDMVFDLIAGETQARSWTVLKRGGVMVSTLTEPSQDEARKRGKRGLRYTVRENAEDLAEIAALIDAGDVRPKVGRIFGWTEAAQAQDCMQHGHTEGKIVLQMEA
jgi:NADPH:quinone reductase-like Zn-dependent oxidoreductase